jgi:ferredoxin-NADP reductase
MPATEPAPAVPKRLPWMTAEVREVIKETPRVVTLMLDAPDWPGHRPGQHVDVRLTGEDGYQAQRSYSVASAPEDAKLALTVERIDDGEVSPYLSGDVRPGDKFELRGPIGGHFVWTAALGGPLLLVAGGSGIVPLMAMLRHRARMGSHVPAHLLYSSRSLEDVIYRRELDSLVARSDRLTVTHALTRRQPPGWTGPARRIDRDMLAGIAFAAETPPRIFICGPTPLVETVSRIMLELGHAPTLIKTERFGPTG